MDALLRWRLPRLTLFQRIVIANTIIIVVGAIGGTLVTVHLASSVGEVGLIIAFVAVGVLISFIINFLLVRAALKPLFQLSERAGAVAAGGGLVKPVVTPNADSDVRQLAQTLGDLVQQLENRNHELHALSQRIMDGQEIERKRLARSLHDDTSQYLSMLIVRLERLEHKVPLEPGLLQAQLVASRELAQQILKELRKIIHGLRPTVLDDLGLVPAIRWYGRLSLEEVGIPVTFNLPEESPPITDRQSEAFFRITQEAINNIVHHARAGQSIIDLKVDDRSLCLSVADDGCGFDPARIGEHRLGLLGMAEWAALVGGKFELDTAPGHGTRIQVRLNYSTSQEGGDCED